MLSGTLYSFLVIPRNHVSLINVVISKVLYCEVRCFDEVTAVSSTYSMKFDVVTVIVFQWQFVLPKLF